MRYYRKLEMTMSITKGHTRFIPCSLHSDCKNVQKSALKSVNVQRTGKSILQMFAFSFFDGSHICRFLPIFEMNPESWTQLKGSLHHLSSEITENCRGTKISHRW